MNLIPMNDFDFDRATKPNAKSIFGLNNVDINDCDAEVEAANKSMKVIQRTFYPKH